MSAATTWLPISISATSLAVSLAVAVAAEMVRRKERDRILKIEHKQHLAELRLIVQKLIVKWRNSQLNTPYAVTDDNWRAVLDRVKEWRTTLYQDQADLLAYTDTSQGKTRPFYLLNRTVKAAMAFERVVEPIVDRWEPRPEGVDPYEDRRKVQDAISALQSEFYEALDALDDLRGEELILPTRQ
ncbi:hypothetical protein ACWDR3_38085 [Streptomyces sp. NPDC001002]